MLKSCATNISYCSADVEWPGLVNALSGLVCAHLNDIGPPSTYQPHFSFQPQGAVIGAILCQLLSCTFTTTVQYVEIDDVIVKLVPLVISATKDI